MLYALMRGDRRSPPPPLGILLYLKDLAMTLPPAAHPEKRGRFFYQLHEILTLDFHFHFVSLCISDYQ